MKFKKLISKVDWDVVAKYSALMASLSIELKQPYIEHNIPSDYNILVEILKSPDNQI
jgi:hypothetical protein